MKYFSVFYILLLSIISLQSNVSISTTLSIQNNSKLNYTGTYQHSSEGITLMLSLNHDQENMLVGTLESSNSSQFNLEGMVSEGVASGVCYNNNISLFFEAYLDGQDLTLALIEPDEYNMPNYNAVKYIIFTRVSSQNKGEQIVDKASPQTNNYEPAVQSETKNSYQNNPSNTKPSGEVVKDDLNGFQFSKPKGWIHNQVDGQILLGSNVIPGLISVFPHQAQSNAELRNEMQQGIQEEGVYLMLEGNLKENGSNSFTGMYNGYVQGETAKGYGIGILSPHKGGIFILAVSTPEKLGKEIIAATDFISQNTRFSKASTGDINLVKHFAGEWAWSNGYRTSWMTFFPDGSYSDQQEASYSGNTNDQYGNVSGNWGAANQNKNRGRWSIKGSKENGVIYIVYPNGNQEQFKYRVFVERGQKYYREYIINGYHYAKNKDY